MEPITLCGAVIVVFGLWIECESTVKLLVRSVSNSKILKGMISLTSRQRTVHTNRYAAYTR